MDQLRIVCPHCQFARDIRRDQAPKQPVTATCPRCKGKFLLDPAKPAMTPPPSPPQPTAGEATPPRQQPPAPSSPSPSSHGAPPRQTPRPARPAPARQGELRGIGELLGNAWTVFQSRFATLFIIYLLFLLAAAAAPVAAGALGFTLASLAPSAKGAVTALSAIIGAAVGILGFSWGWGACVAASLDETLDTRAAFAVSREKLLPFALVSFLVSFIITGGYLLFVIPGIIFSVWFFFANFVIFDDDTRGMSALLKSRAYTAGRWFDVFLRLVVIWACLAVVGAIPVAGLLLTLVAIPYVMVYQALLFKDLKEAAGEVIYPCGFGDGARWVGLAALGYVAIPALLLATFGAALHKNLAPLMGAGGPVISLPAPTNSGGGDGDFRVIPIPPQGEPSGGIAVAPVEGGSAPSFPSSSQPAEQNQARHPEHIHVFIYSVNYGGKVEANGATIRNLETKPDMQYNYNENGEELSFGPNTITVDYAPVKDPAATMEPRLHLKISYWNGSDKRVLGDWEIRETTPGRKTFNLDIPPDLGKQ
uniref:Zinc finger/thioredoxin putative domain-containing protein n=1 Tax=Geobacter metallireducens TaxID=28232 RepID=A0A831XM04_GEOME